MKIPEDFENYFLDRWRQQDVAALLLGMEGEPAVSIRLNTSRMPAGSEPRGADGHVPWCPEGIYLGERPAFTADPLLHAGAYYVQEASSMFLAYALRALLPSGFRGAALDLCAAPGGKSTLLRALLPDECLLLSNEPIRARAQVLAENIAKWGHEHVVVTQAYAADIAAAVCAGATLPLRDSQAELSPFSLIVADVPCSGEGMMRKEAEAVRQWSPAFVAECAALQRTIVADIWPALRPGGLLLYSTCTFNPEEDEQNVEWIAATLGADVLTIPVDPAWGICGDLRRDISTPLSCYHFLPGRVRGEGFFLAALRKHIPAETAETQTDHCATTIRKKPRKKATIADITTLPTDQLDLAPANGPSTRRHTARTTPVAAPPSIDLSLTDALRYLQREALILPPSAPRGIVQVSYRGQRLGLMNNLGSRANNLYPKEWRIRSTHLTPQSLFDEAEQ